MKLEVSKAEVSILQQALNDTEAMPSTETQLGEMMKTMIAAMVGVDKPNESDMHSNFDKARQKGEQRKNQNTALRAKLNQLANQAAEHDLTDESSVNAPTTVA